eukprot:3294010-Rhodomonas_salina.1
MVAGQGRGGVVRVEGRSEVGHAVSHGRLTGLVGWEGLSREVTIKLRLASRPGPCPLSFATVHCHTWDLRADPPCGSAWCVTVSAVSMSLCAREFGMTVWEQS